MEGGKEETVVSLEHALAVVHTGQHHRTVVSLLVHVCMGLSVWWRDAMKGLGSHWIILWQWCTTAG